ncbi:MAG: BREX system Lon protease-like protein BrxL [Gallionellales bacterium CG_4_10_14_3_um_filter_54_96]|nr:MAG: BREX system Lon protease-like protein BrxL [Gallionellales bacterium CG17_big_fil_post_rev_8_21_14_2_50_54_146]PIX03948.1 MAG: BREX system Lon protease-like protein BrxL [Gallionellales bacterium CG_4_8_14_3_um_filter_54_18]PIY06342.1 MAG: BREX system Lon protease-like protein BrxL [Gallionellales bacterium CG_4_10_14_3_um_filter_54_96]PJC05621.1 MAG: BREX system Lon protease-like protein BrxL [Gallionellales bacterium CG_4_9_14_0_8_um_filter_55_61]
MIELDEIDKKAADVLEGYLVRKDLVRTFSRQFPVPTYVVEFMLGRYCASIVQEEIEEGLEIVQRQLKSRTVKAGEEELFKARALETGEVKIIDLITARVDNKGEYVASLPSLRLTDVRISGELVNQHERMLTGGFYAEISITFDVAIAQEARGRPFGVTSLREIQLSKRDVLDILAKARHSFTTEEWKNFLLRSIGIEATDLTVRQKNALLLRMVPFVERNYNLVELGPRGTGKSHLYQQVSPYAHLISGGKATVAKMFVENTAKGRRGLVCQYDVVCFDEVSGISFDQKDGVNIMKGYMESGEFSRGKESIRADGSIVLVGNFEVDVEHQQRIGHLFGPLPPEMRDDTAFMDRIHAFLPGWDVPKISKDIVTNHFGLVSDFLSECWSQLRNQSRVSQLQNRVFFGGALSGRDTNAVNKTVSGLLKLLYPGGEDAVPEEDLEWAVRIAMESRRRVKEQQKRVGAAEFRNTHFSYVMGADGIEKFVSTPELQSDNSIGGDPLEPGQVWSISPGGGEENSGLYRIEVNEGPGTGVKVLNKPIPPAFRESVGYAEQNLYARSVQLVGDKDPRQHEFTVQLRAFDASKSGSKLGVASLVALCTSLLKRSVRGGLIIVGEINLGGSIEPVHNAVTIAEIAVEKGATALLMPVSCRRQLVDLSDDMATKIDIQFYSDAKDALLKAMAE